MKIKKIAIVCLVLLSTVVLAGCSQQSQDIKDAFNKGQDKGREVLNTSFSEDEAKKKIQEYKITVDLSDSSKGTTIIEYYVNRGEIPAIENIGWFAEKTDEDGKYIVGYGQKVDGLLQEPRWEVTRDTVKALNGKAITITPEFGPQPDKQ
jgi:hypothetical protein